MVSGLECYQQTFLGNVIIALFVYGSLTTIMIFILIWLLRNNFKKGEKNESSNLPKS